MRGFGFTGFGFGTNNGTSLGTWTPWNLGNALLGFWDAETASSVSLSGSNVVTWTDLVGGYGATQATSGSQPLYSTNNFNGRPSVVFDGIDDFLTYAAQPFPAAANPSELWALVSQEANPLAITTLSTLSYGGDATARAIARVVVTTVNRGRGSSSGTGTATAVNSTVDFTGIHMARLRVTPTTINFSVDGGAETTSSLVSATETQRVRIGTAAFSSATSWTGKMNALLVTAPLTDAQGTRLTAFLKARGGIA